MEAIQFSGLNDLGSEDQVRVKDLAAEYYEKIQRSLKNITSLQIRVKPYKTAGGDGKKKKFSVNAKAIAPTAVLAASADDWDIARVMHKVMQDIEHEIQHRFHSDDQHDKPY